MGDQGGGRDKARPGDWNCPGCRDLQFARNMSCRRCACPKPLPSNMGAQASAFYPMGGMGLGVNPMSGDWLCHSCGDLVFGRNKDCRRCGTTRPASAQGIPGQLAEVPPMGCPPFGHPPGMPGMHPCMPPGMAHAGVHGPTMQHAPPPGVVQGHCGSPYPGVMPGMGHPPAYPGMPPPGYPGCPPPGFPGAAGAYGHHGMAGGVYPGWGQWHGAPGHGAVHPQHHGRRKEDARGGRSSSSSGSSSSGDSSESSCRVRSSSSARAQSAASSGAARSSSPSKAPRQTAAKRRRARAVSPGGGSASAPAKRGSRRKAAKEAAATSQKKTAGKRRRKTKVPLADAKEEDAASRTPSERPAKDKKKARRKDDAGDGSRGKLAKKVGDGARGKKQGTRNKRRKVVPASAASPSQSDAASS